MASRIHAIVSIGLIATPIELAAQEQRPFACFVQPGEWYHSFVHCGDVTFYGHVTRMMTVDPVPKPFWNGYVYRLGPANNSISRNPFIEIVIPQEAARDGKIPNGAITCQWQDSFSVRCR